MNERAVREFLGQLRRLVRQQGLYPDTHPLAREGVAAAVNTANGLMPEGGECVLTLMDDAIYLGPSLLAHASLEFNGILRDLQKRGIDSITLISLVRPADASDLASFIAGFSDDLPAAGSIRLNERPLSRSDLEHSEIGALRSSYAASLDLLRGIGFAMKGDGDFELSGVANTVRDLVEQTMSQPGASLLLATVKGHDEYTYYHSVNTSIYALALGRLIGLDEERLVPLGMGALLHDIGKVGVAASILQHPGRLDAAQWEEIKLHPQSGAEAILAASGRGQEVAAVIALEHHARFDGTGYPKVGNPHTHPHDDGNGHRQPSRGGLHFYSRMVSVADTYDAITTRRSYRRAETPNRALHVLLTGAASSYDPDFVRAFIHMMGAYPAGSILQLDSGDVVMVTHLIDHDPGRPAGVLVRTAEGELMLDPQPVPFGPGDVVEQLLPERAGIDPATLLEKPSVRQSLGF